MIQSVVIAAADWVYFVTCQTDTTPATKQASLYSLTTRLSTAKQEQKVASFQFLLNFFPNMTFQELRD